VEVRDIPDSLMITMPYGGQYNFTGEQLYPCRRCFLVDEAAAALQKVRKELNDQGFILVILDCYRPISVQKRMWQIKPNPIYVTDPKKGSMHNKGLALDLTLADKNGCIIDMGTDFDEFSRQSFHGSGATKQIREHRLALKSACEKYGLLPITSEWWHYSLRRRGYPVLDFIWDCL